MPPLPWGGQMDIMELFIVSAIASAFMLGVFIGMLLPHGNPPSPHIPEATLVPLTLSPEG